MNRSGFIRRETLCLLAIVFVLSALVIWVRTATVKYTYAYVRQEKELRELQQEIQRIRVRWLKQASPGKLEALAPKLGLFPPRFEQVVRVKNP